MKPKVGRPRNGTRAARYRAGESVSRFVKLTGRYPAQLAARLRALATHQGEPVWALLCEAAEGYLAALPPATKREVDRAARREVRELERDAEESYERNLELKARARGGLRGFTVGSR